MRKPIWVIGLGLGDSQTLSPQVSAIIQHAEVLIGSQRLLVPWESHSAEKIPMSVRKFCIYPPNPAPRNGLK